MISIFDFLLVVICVFSGYGLGVLNERCRKDDEIVRNVQRRRK